MNVAMLETIMIALAGITGKFLAIYILYRFIKAFYQKSRKARGKDYRTLG